MVPGGYFVFNYVTAANYFGELVEWCGFLMLTWPSPASGCFLYMTFCNLAPRAWSRHQRYIREIVRNFSLFWTILFILLTDL